MIRSSLSVYGRQAVFKNEEGNGIYLLKRIERQNKNNHLNLPKAGAEKVEKPEAKVMK